MKKITLIACAALVAGLLVSCDNGSSVKEMNYVGYTSTENSYVVTGTKTVVKENSSESFDADDDQTAGTIKKYTETYYYTGAEGYVYFTTSNQNDYNYQDYTIALNNSIGYYSKEWDTSKTYSTIEKDYVKDTTTDIEKGTDDPDTLLDPKIFNAYAVDGVLYISDGNAQNWAVEADEEALAAGESFTFKVTYTTADSTSATTNKDGAGDQKDRSSSSSKTTVTYNLTFTAK